MMVNATVAVVPLRPAAVGVAARRYRPGASFLPAMRPVNLKRLTPTTPVRVKEPFTAVQRLQAFFFLFLLVGLSHLPFLPARPFDGRSTVKRTVAGRSSL